MTHIKDNLYLDADERQFMLKEFVGYNKKGEELYKTHGYYRKPEEALESIVNIELSRKIAAGTPLSDLVRELKRMRKYFEKKLEGVE